MRSFLSLRTLSLTSSCLFLIGIVLSFIGYLGIGNPGYADDRATSSILQIVSWTIISMSTIPEIWIDIISGTTTTTRLSSSSTSNNNTSTTTTTAFFHGRYGSRSSIIVSWAQSFIFLGGTITMGMSMKRYWDDDIVYKNDFFRQKNYMMTSWEALWLISIILFIISGLLSVLSSGCCCWGEGRERGYIQLVQISNIMFFSGAIAQLISATLIDSSQPGSFSGTLLVIASYVMWCGCGVLWIIADAIMLPPPRDDGVGEDTNNNNMNS